MKNLLLYIFLLISVLSFSQNESSLAESYYKEAAYKKAIPLYQKLVKSNSFNTFYSKRLITCYQEIGLFDKSHEHITNLLQQNSYQTFWYVELGFNYQKQQKDSLAVIQYQKAIDAIKSNPNIGGITGRFFKENSLLDYAVKAYELTMELNQYANYEFQLAIIYGEQGEVDKMFNSYLNLIEANADHVGAVQRIASNYITENPNNTYNIALRKALIKKLVQNPNTTWNKILSWLYTNQEEYQKAFIQEQAIFKRESEGVSRLVTLGKVAYSNQVFDVSKDVFHFVLNNSVSIDNKLEAELFLLKIARENKPENAVDLFKNTLNTYGYTVNTILIQKEYADFLTFTLNQSDKAKTILENALKLNLSKFEKARIKLKLGDIFVFTNQFNSALVLFSQVQSQLKNHPLGQQARFKVAEASFFKNDFKWAKTQLKVLKGSTSQLIANDAADLFLIISDNEPRDSLSTGLSDFAKAKLLSYQNKNKEAISVYNIILDRFKGQNIEDEALLELAKLYSKETLFNDALNVLQKLINIDKNGIFVDDAYYIIAEIYKNNIKDREKALEYYQKIIFEQASSIYLVEARKKFRLLRGDNINQ